MCRLSWFLDPGGWSKTTAVRLYFIFPGICTLSLDNRTYNAELKFLATLPISTDHVFMVGNEGMPTLPTVNVALVRITMSSSGITDVLYLRNSIDSVNPVSIEQLDLSWSRKSH
ncbi:hypothetical protein STEG23_002074, partial [Scotinomys teguina]